MKLIKFHQNFSNEQACRDFLANERWGSSDQAICPHCRCTNTYKYEDGKLFKCAECKKQFTVRIGTIFEDSRIPLIKWFIAIYLFSSMKKGISSIQLGKYIEVTQKTAWFMLHRIREVMSSGNSPFDGITEVDEAYFGGKEGNKYKSKKETKPEKAVVLGIVNREPTVGKHSERIKTSCQTKQVKSFNVESADKENLLPKIGCNVKGSNIITDSYHDYKGLKKQL
jgi:transposase-like protein